MDLRGFGSGGFGGSKSGGFGTVDCTTTFGASRGGFGRFDGYGEQSGNATSIFSRPSVQQTKTRKDSHELAQHEVLFIGEKNVTCQLQEQLWHAKRTDKFIDLTD